MAGHVQPQLPRRPPHESRGRARDARDRWRQPVHLGSDSARLPEVGNLDYAAAKLAPLALSTSLATEFSPQGIRSNVVVPGPTRTPLYDRPGGFGDQAAEVWGIDKETAITRMVTEIRPLLTGRMGQPGRHRTGRRIPCLTTIAPSHRRRMERRRRRAAPHLTPPPTRRSR